MGQLAEIDSPPVPEAPPPIVGFELPKAPAPPGPPQPTRVSPFQEWLRQEGYWYITSAVVHAIGFVVVAIIATFLPGTFYALGLGQSGEAPTFETSVGQPDQEFQADPLPVGDPPLDPSSLGPGILTIRASPPHALEDYDDSTEFERRGGGRPMDLVRPELGGMGGIFSTNPAGVAEGSGGVGTGKGTGDNPGTGGDGTGFGGRGKGRHGLGGSGATQATERSVAAALHWLARHQAPAGNWSLQFFDRQCMSSRGCSGKGAVDADDAATALALLPFLGAGQTHRTKGPYEKHVRKGISWLIKQQQANGCLAIAQKRPMYSHGLATIVLCEAYGMTQDSYVGQPALRTLQFIEQAQHPSTGGWRYFPGDEGDTSVTGWQVMALKSGQMAKLPVNPMVLENVEKWLKSVSAGRYGGLYRYQANEVEGVKPSMTAVGMLCRQYLGIDRNAPSMLEGKAYLLAHLPSADSERDTYYWYYATLAMHNFMGPEWDAWNRPMRRTLIKTQCKNGGCAEGSWDPDQPTADRWGSPGGRLMITSLSTLTLEVYYRFMPLFRTNLPVSHGPGAAIQNPAVTETPEEKPAGTSK